VKSVYVEPIARGDATIIPIARISYAFGGGGGAHDPERASPISKGGVGGGGGGRLSAAPAGALEIRSAGTHFHYVSRLAEIGLRRHSQLCPGIRHRHPARTLVKKNAGPRDDRWKLLWWPNSESVNAISTDPLPLK
jgi:Sporulation protein YtfJ (Spore_YtfJ)